MTVKIKRIYEQPSDADGFRILVDRLWPRGIKKENARLDLWSKDIAPSSDLRKWYGHDPEKFEKFSTRYKAELDNNPEISAFLETIKAHDTVTLLFSAKDSEHNNAAVLAEWIKERTKT